MITALFHDSDTARVRGLWQWDYGQVLRIQGLQLPTAVEIQFSLDETGGKSKTRVGITKDGITDVTIPDFVLENEGATSDYNIYAFIYLTDKTSGKTVKKIVMQVWARSKPEAFDTPEEAELFREAIAEVNKSATNAQNAEKSAKAWAHGDHENYPDRDEDNAAYYAGEARKDASQTAEDREVVAALAENVNTDAMQVDADKKEAEQYKNQASTSAANALLSEQAAKVSETAAKEAQASAEAAEGQAELFAAQTEEDKNTVEQAKAAVMEIGQEVAEKKNYVEQTADSFELLHQQAVDDVNNAGQSQTERVEGAGNQAVNNVNAAGATQVSEIQKYKGVMVSSTEPTEEAVEVWIDPDNDEEYQLPEIKDDEENEEDTWSSNKIAREIGGLKSDLDSKFSVKESVNLWNPETTVIGQLNIYGNVNAEATDYVSTDYIPYKSGEQIWLCFYRKDTEEIALVTPQVSNGSILCLYDKNKNFLERFYSGFHGIRGYTIDNPDCAYIRYTYAYAHWSNPARIYCLSKTNIENAEDFEEYYAPIVYLKNVTDPSNPTKVSELENDVGYITNAEQANMNVVSCRGDSLTDGAGATNGNTYPKILQDLLGDGYTVNNFGIGGEGTKGTSWRFGSTPIYLAPCTIPESGSVDCKIIDASGADVAFLLRGGTIPSNPSLSNFNVNPVVIGGIEGVLARKSTTENAYTFTRNSGGQAVTLDRPTFISTYGYRNNTKDITVFWCGTNDTQSWKGYMYIINYLKQMVDLLPHKNYIVCGLTCLNLHSDIATKNEQLSLAFGRHFLDLRYYLLNYGLADAGITPTAEDETAIASGEMPPSLLSDDVHFNSNGYAVIANCIYRKGVELGYW